ncbi:WSC-domain-containing protein [Dacryopinax primogenitus]|uniref:WSC-domain-containing protein n=1 Tax=Dacryopinax primogenitus (strain DJM 731) TaxID=1858805 RepID=M5FPH6_DACPD|nr:WSC-domain-containing protein [Dacryopinax primogenitus]EJT97083.1 WSC-domain-containing protein [Dacryopinax primogenitus]
MRSSGGIHTGLLGLLALAARPAAAFFRMGCGSSLVIERADPIVSPGKPSSHLHNIVGGNGFDFNMTYDDARASTCSTCEIVEDLSNYWVPTLHQQAANGSFIQVPLVSPMTVYYLQRYNSNNTTLKAFPPGFRMLAGNPNLRSYTDTLAQQAVSFVCLDYSGTSDQTNVFPTKNCPDGLRTQIFFPSCWDGVNLDSPDHMSHVAYPSGMDNGDCPITHPVRLVSIFYEVIWHIALFWPWPTDTPPFVLSCGDPTGTAFHGDFMNGWAEDVLQSAIDQCTNLSGLVSDCPVVTVRTSDQMNDCAMPSRVEETVGGYLDALPGCNPVTPGPANAVPVANCPVPAILPKGEASFLKPVPGWTALGCGLDEGPRILPNRYTNGAMTVEACVDICATNGFTYAGLEWAQECWCGNTLDTTRLGQYACDMPCQGDPSEFCGASSRLAVYSKGGAAPVSTSSSTASTVAAPTSSSTPASSSAAGSALSNVVSVPASSNVPAPTSSSSSSVSKPSNTPSAPSTPNNNGCPKPAFSEFGGDVHGRSHDL